ncbi:MAG: hypothetical protein B1H05_04640 [Candidatus Cloacimonas sp. 4484_140]|nr:MAG: hypothetical protein B1H05_04640 [Candidatus Cloacimonas sp. 4484_140]
MFRSVIKEEIQVPAQIEYLGELRNFVTKAGRKHGFSDTIVNAFKLSIDEAATNIIKHAYRDWEGTIKMRIVIKKNSMTVILIDQGKYFDPSRISDPDLNRYVNIGKKGGLGIFIIRKLIDEIDYRHTEEGNELRLTKYRVTEKKKRKVLAIPSLSLNLKTRYFAITATILTAAVLIVYFYFFFKHPKVVFNDFVNEKKPLCETIAKEVLKEGEKELNLVYVDSKVLEYINGKDEIYRVIVTDNSDWVVNSTDTSLFSSFFTAPDPHDTPCPGVIKYKDHDGETIYSFISDVLTDEVARIKVGTVYLEVKEDYVTSKVWALRLKNLQLVALVLIFGYLGIIILVYFILNPFRKLANWIKEMGSGEVKDEIDFEANDEVGEIAKAFSDITDTLRDSQKNLAEQERIQKEMQLAQDIQQTLLPAEVPKLEGYEISSFYEAAKEVGGDYYDFIEVDKDTLGIVIADVSGKGVPGSLIMTMIRTALRTEARSIKSASEVLARVNEFVVKDMKKGMFVTLFYIIIDSKRRRINYASAGHNPMILYRKSNNKTFYLNPRGFPVGISLPDSELFKKSIESDTIQLAEDDILILYTDGITEAMNNRREMFGEERLLQVIREYGHLSTEDFVEKLKDEIHSFTEGFEQNDDITLVAIKERSTPEKIELKRAQKAHKMILQGKNIRDACEECGITAYAYYNKYKRIFEEEGVDAFEIDEAIAVEAKHLSIEEKTKIYDIIKKHPEYGAKRISEELNTEKYGYTQINENRIYDELVRSRLNTRQLREAFITRSGRKKRMKPPGTPMLTLDGRIILDRSYQEMEPEPEPPRIEEKPEKSPVVPQKEEIEPLAEQSEEVVPEEQDDNFYLESLMSMPIEELLKKRRREKKKKTKEEPTKAKESQPFEEIKLADTDKDKERADIDILFEEISGHKIEEKSDSTAIDADSEEFLNLMDTKQESELEEEISFRDLWEGTEQNIKPEIEEELAKEEPSQLKEEEEIEAERETEEKDTEKSDGEIDTKSTIDIDEILSDSQEGDSDIDFDILTEDASFQDEILNQDEISADDLEASFAETNVEPSDDQYQENINDAITDSDKESEQKLISKEKIDILEEDNVETEVEFTFNDLLDEIDNDIAFIDEENFDDNQELEKEYDISETDKKMDDIDKELALLEKQPDNEGQEDDQMQDKHLLFGLKLYREGKYKHAIYQFLYVIKKYPAFKEVYSILGNAYYHLNMIEKAVETYQRVKELDPQDTDSYENTGVIYANQGRLDEAIREWKMVMKIDPNRKDILEHIEEAEQLIKSNSS